MLLEEVDSVVSTKLNTIIREAEKRFLCTLNYEANIGSIDFFNYLYLTTDAKILIDGKSYTTFSGHRVRKAKSKFMSNTEFIVKCPSEEVKIGYVNRKKYLHLPDFLSTQILYLFKGGVKAVVDNVVLIFTPNGVKVYKLSTTVPKPYYVFVTPFEYNENADLLAKIIGLTDVYKRNLLESDDNSKYFYFLYPYVSLVLYKRLRTTLYPPYVNTLVSDVYNLLKDRVEKEANMYFSKGYVGLAEDIKTLIEDFNRSSKIIIK